MTTQFSLICAETGERFGVEAGFVIGRDTDADVRLNSKTVSGRHAHIRLEGDNLMLEDLDSTNGVQLGGRSVRRVRLHHGQVFRFGERHLHVIDMNQPNTGPLERDPLDNPSFDVIDDSGNNETVFRGGYALPPSWSKTDYQTIGTLAATPSNLDHKLLVDLLQHHKVNAAETKAALMLLSETADNTIYLLSAGHAPNWSLGSHSDQQVIIDLASVAPHHATISIHDGTWHIKSEQSPSCTGVNGNTTDRSALRSGDVISLGDVRLVFHAI